MALTSRESDKNSICYGFLKLQNLLKLFEICNYYKTCWSNDFQCIKSFVELLEAFILAATSRESDKNSMSYGFLKLQNLLKLYEIYAIITKPVGVMTFSILNEL